MVRRNRQSNQCCNKCHLFSILSHVYFNQPALCNSQNTCAQFHIHVVKILLFSTIPYQFQHQCVHHHAVAFQSSCAFVWYALIPDLQQVVAAGGNDRFKNIIQFLTPNCTNTNVDNLCNNKQSFVSGKAYQRTLSTLTKNATVRCHHADFRTLGSAQSFMIDMSVIDVERSGIV